MNGVHLTLIIYSDHILFMLVSITFLPLKNTQYYPIMQKWLLQ